jgi:hypothetical protein
MVWRHRQDHLQTLLDYNAGHTSAMNPERAQVLGVWQLVARAALPDMDHAAQLQALHKCVCFERKYEEPAPEVQALQQ